jgi:hypothetical protein
MATTEQMSNLTLNESPSKQSSITMIPSGNAFMAIPSSFQTQPPPSQEAEVKPPTITEEQKKILREGNLVLLYYSQHTGAIIDNFFKKTASQFTYTGLYKLHETIRDNQLCVLFRNNHFSTLFKYKGELYSLITDAGYLHEPIVWEKLDEVTS